MKRSKHSLSNYKLLSCKMGGLVPIGLVEVLPGDTIQHATSMLLRTSPLVSPVMHPVHAKIHHWFVPFRIIWDDFEDFITGGPAGTSAPTFPTITTPASTGFPVGSLADYLGVTPGVASAAISALPFRAYAMIFNEWYRDEDLVTPVGFSTASGSDSTTNTSLLNKAWDKDYFTTARPWRQKGTAVPIPVNGSAPVLNDSTVTNPWQVRKASDDTLYNSGTLEGLNTPDLGDLSDATTKVKLDPQGGLFASLSAGDGFIDVNDFRLAIQLQSYKENRARYGSRFTEYLRFLGVKSSDARLQRPEYLGGGKQTVQFSEVLQTAPAYVPSDDEQNGDVGTLKGHGIAAMRSNRYRRFFEEPGYVISLLSVNPIPMYAQGMNKTWLKRTKEEFFQKELQFIGQQEVKMAEVWAKILESNPATNFGYQDRYDEYRRIENTIAGQFRDTLDYWHMARIFSTTPSLNADFVTSNPTNRIFADQSGADTLLIMAQHSIQARRLVAKLGTPARLF